MGKEKKLEKSLDLVIEEFDVYFHECFGSKLPVAFIQDSGWKPMTDVYETDSELVVRIEVGGISGRDIDLTWEGNSIVISGTRKEQKKTEPRKYHKIEITTGRFERRIAVPSNITIDRDSLHMEYRGGIIEIRAKTFSPD